MFSYGSIVRPPSGAPVCGCDTFIGCPSAKIHGTGFRSASSSKEITLVPLDVTFGAFHRPLSRTKISVWGMRAMRIIFKLRGVAVNHRASDGTLSRLGKGPQPIENVDGLRNLASEIESSVIQNTVIDEAKLQFAGE